ncbi:hypothetical protein PSU4_07700 [Pseudonocardia sulfidoxydans NBRC 16205]|uniref:Uncharacterized protein n=1 Tax=Pseudonocardia sulfidoxydans NBRC 16205 TaxID=1223511 RepID=A0A511DAJ1_9PSEU|nr:hypothetical protein PSU4_07700 [Pseudonocardia sulfidoxydans NBRC 16205]
MRPVALDVHEHDVLAAQRGQQLVTRGGAVGVVRGGGLELAVVGDGGTDLADVGGGERGRVAGGDGQSGGLGAEHGEHGPGDGEHRDDARRRRRVPGDDAGRAQDRGRHQGDHQQPEHHRTDDRPDGRGPARGGAHEVDTAPEQAGVVQRVEWSVEDGGEAEVEQAQHRQDPERGPEHDGRDPAGPPAQHEQHRGGDEPFERDAQEGGRGECAEGRGSDQRDDHHGDSEDAPHPTARPRRAASTTAPGIVDANVSRP